MLFSERDDVASNKLELGTTFAGDHVVISLEESYEGKSTYYYPNAEQLDRLIAALQKAREEIRK